MASIIIGGSVGKGISAGGGGSVGKRISKGVGDGREMMGGVVGAGGVDEGAAGKELFE